MTTKQPGKPVVPAPDTGSAVTSSMDTDSTNGSSTNGSSSTTPPPPNQVPWRWQFWVTIAVLCIFALFGLVMLLHADVSDNVWKNRMVIFGSVQAIVFTAIGWLFGREVNRGEVETAKKSATEAKEEAKDARTAKEAQTADLTEAKETAAAEQQKGRALVAAVESGIAGSGPDSRPMQPPSGGQSSDVNAQQPRGDALRNFASRLYPELYENHR